MSKKLVVMLLIIVLTALAIGFFIHKRQTNGTLKQTNQVVDQPQIQSPAIISTKPAFSDQTIIPADQIIEITFNRSLENVGEFKVRIEPKVEVKIELSGDRKTARITPVKPYELGTSYSLMVGPDTKFDGVGAWGQDKTFQFRTVKYTGV